MHDGAMTELLAISGSLRQGSSNTELLRAAARLAPRGVTVRLYDELASLPHFNPDLLDCEPAVVGRLRAQIGRADGLLISSPEYARGVSGALKNALDWLVSGSEFVAKPVAVFNASPRAHHADDALRLTLTTMSGHLVEAASISLALLGRNLGAAEIAADPQLSAALRTALHDFVGAIAARASALP
jgi:chromate reductase, NAD(P)H dehydrogenase (quinone)